MKKLLVSVIIVFVVFIIYLNNVDKKIYYVNIGSMNGYTKGIVSYLQDKNIYQEFIDYSNDKLRIIDIHNSIDSNEKINNITLKQALIKADLTTIYLGENDIYNVLMLDNYTKNEKYSYIDEYIKQLDSLLSLIRKYCKEDIFLLENINIHKNMDINNYLSYLNEKCVELANKYNITFIKLDNVYNYIDNGINIEGFDYIKDQIINGINNNILDK